MPRSNTQTQVYYHASFTDHGETMEFTQGGKYEKIKDGIPQQKHLGGEYIG